MADGAKYPTRGASTDWAKQLGGSNRMPPSHERLLKLAETVQQKRNELNLRAKQVDISDLYTYVLRCTLIPICAEDFIPPPTPTPSAANASGGASGPTGFQVPLEVITEFQKLTEARYRVLSQVPTERTPHLAVFVKSAKTLLDTVLSSSSVHTGILSNFRDLITVLASQVDSQIRNHKSDSMSHDDLLLAVMDMYVSLIREAIYKTLPASPLPSSPELKNYKTHLTKFLSDVSDKDLDMDEVKDVKLASWAKVVFKMSDQAHGSTLAEVLRATSKKTVLSDFKALIELAGRGQLPGYTPRDFVSSHGHESFVKSVKERVQTVMTDSAQRWPELKSIITTTAPTARQGTSLFVPPDPYSYFRVLYAICINRDAPTHPHTFLSNLTRNLVTECADRWQIPRIYRDLCFAENLLKLLASREGHARLSDLFDVLEPVVLAFERNRSNLSWAELSLYVHVMTIAETTLRKSFLGFFEIVASSGDDSKQDEISSCANGLHWIYQDETLVAWESLRAASDVTSFSRSLARGLGEEGDGAVGRIRDLALEAVMGRYKRVYEDAMSTSEKSETDIARLTRLVKAVRAEIQAYIIGFPELLDGTINVDELACSNILRKYIILEMGTLRDQLGVKGAEFSIAEMLELYQIIRMLKSQMGSPTDSKDDQDDEMAFDIELWFAPFVSKWLDVTEAKTAEWVDAAVRNDTFKPVLPPSVLHSTSVVDIFSSFHQALDFIETLKWENPLTKGKFLSRFAKVMGKALNLYVERLMGSFFTVDAKQQTANLDEAPAPCAPELCIRLNNLIDALRRLKEMEAIMNAPLYNKLITDFNASHPPKKPTGLASYSLRIINARALDSKGSTDGSPGEYYGVIRMEGEYGRRYLEHLNATRGLQASQPQTTTDPLELGRTKSVVSASGAGDPNWNETFLLSEMQDLPYAQVEIVVFKKTYGGFGTEKPVGWFALYLPFNADAERQGPPAGSPFLPLNNLEDYSVQERKVYLDDERRSQIYIRVWKNDADKDPQYADNLHFWLERARSDLEQGVGDALGTLEDQMARFTRRTFHRTVEKLGVVDGGAARVESAIGQVTKYLDDSFSVINMWLDLKVGEWVASKTKMKMPAKWQRWKKREEAMQELARGGSMHDIEIDDDVVDVPPNLLIMHFYNTINRNVIDGLKEGIEKWSHSTGYGVLQFFSVDKKKEAEDVNLRKRKIAECALEGLDVVRSLMLCDVDGVKYGFEWGDIESASWRRLRDLLMSVIDEKAPELLRQAEEKAKQLMKEDEARRAAEMAQTLEAKRKEASGVPENVAPTRQGSGASALTTAQILDQSRRGSEAAAPSSIGSETRKDVKGSGIANPLFDDLDVDVVKVISKHAPAKLPAQPREVVLATEKAVSRSERAESELRDTDTSAPRMDSSSSEKQRAGSDKESSRQSSVTDVRARYPHKIGPATASETQNASILLNLSTEKPRAIDNLVHSEPTGSSPQVPDVQHGGSTHPGSKVPSSRSEQRSANSVVDGSNTTGHPRPRTTSKASIEIKEEDTKTPPVVGRTSSPLPNFSSPVPTVHPSPQPRGSSGIPTSSSSDRLPMARQPHAIDEPPPRVHSNQDYSRGQGRTSVEHSGKMLPTEHVPPRRIAAVPTAPMDSSPRSPAQTPDVYRTSRMANSEAPLPSLPNQPAQPLPCASSEMPTSPISGPGEFLTTEQLRNMSRHRSSDPTPIIAAGKTTAQIQAEARAARAAKASSEASSGYSTPNSSSSAKGSPMPGGRSEHVAIASEGGYKSTAQLQAEARAARAAAGAAGSQSSSASPRSSSPQLPSAHGHRATGSTSSGAPPLPNIQNLPPRNYPLPPNYHQPQTPGVGYTSGSGYSAPGGRPTYPNVAPTSPVTSAGEYTGYSSPGGRPTYPNVAPTSPVTSAGEYKTRAQLVAESRARVSTPPGK
ncbi:hypothetical protein M427DRAFT_150672 [Gonapodya prolifera JEL478]|uniref:Uncharacterized protein n=1 Tax=Gonapodya prolifera (strain JEL478) TaxID=1344416 RepID=A0A139B049_GONPJ|nr:hypothetical protein M427DRAFT_150672 [Gonapodya prolifera JEL478]|eukprot:KXS22372.1 hypothetical protein M427DRAFT_150672 [Gonapodya prolifera JEL478]